MHLWSTSSTAAVLFHTFFFLTIYTFVFYKFNQNFGVDGRQWCKSSVSGYETFFFFSHVVIVFCTLIFFPRGQTVTVDCEARLCAGTQQILAKPTQPILTILQVFPENENFTLKMEYF